MKKINLAKVVLMCALVATASACKKEATEVVAGGTVLALKGVISETLAASDMKKAGIAFAAFDATWENVEDGVKAASPNAYKDIENGMDEVNIAIKKNDAAKLKEAGAKLLKTLDDNAAAFK